MKYLEQMITIFENFHEAVYIVDRQRKILYFNPEASIISGFSKGETQGFFCYDNILNHVDSFGKNLCLSGCPLVEAIGQNKVMDHMVYLHRKLGHRIKVHVRAIPYVEDGEVVGAIEVFTDETQKNLMQQEISIKNRLLLIDRMTGLFNKSFLMDELSEIINKQKAREYGVLFLDIDNFKDINDKFGHLFGDDVLTAIAKTIKSNIAFKDIAIRFGGEELVVFIYNPTKESLLETAEFLRVMISQSRPRLQKYKFELSVSIGATLMRKKEKHMDAIHRADLAMYTAKSEGKNKVVFVE
ncbi:MAG: sensor domain-containing diguanylate cyclase [Acholeplasmataceae bacterium]|nr:sensor domain-containing diguanylate cyclase [Acholeplasmataceae bacterium]